MITGRRWLTEVYGQVDALFLAYLTRRSSDGCWLAPR